MNSRSANSGGSAGPVPSPPPVEMFIVLPDGSCIPATRDKLRIVLRQARSDATKRRRLAAQEKASELQRNLEDRAAARRFLHELAEIDRECRRIAATLRGKVKADRPERQTSDVVKRAPGMPTQRVIAMTSVPSSWVIDDLGMRGIHYQQSYIGRKSPGFYRGAARDRWEYEVRDEAVLRDAHGGPIIVTNIGEDIDEIGAGWQAIEDATTRLNGKIQIRIIVAFDADASDAENVAALKYFCETVLEPLGLAYSAVIHRAPEGGDERNVHAHILTNFRPTARVGPYTWSFADHVRGELDGRDGVQMLRHLWAHSMSEAAEKAQRNMRYTGLGYGARGLDLEGGEHLGEARNAILQRGGKVWADERNRIRQARNAARRAIRDADKKIAALTALRDSIVAQAERAGDVPIRRLVSASAAQQSSGPARLTVFRTAAPERSAERIPASAVGPARPPLVASPLPARRVVLHQSSVTDTARPVPLMSSQRAAAAKQSRPSVAPHMPLPFAASSEHASSPRLRPSRRGLPVHIPLGSAVHTTESPAPSLVSSAREARQGRLTPTSVIAANAAPDSAIRQGRDLIAALARWREAQQQGLAVDPVEATPKPAPPEPRRHAVPRDTGTADRVPPLFISAYRRRRAMAKPVREPTATLPTREWLEDNPRRPFSEGDASQLEADTHLIGRLRKADLYVADFGSGWLELDPQVMWAFKVDDEWLQRAHVQRQLIQLREEQQTAVAALRREVSSQPLAFSKTVDRFWPADIEPALLRRIDRWHRLPSEGFLRDAFPIQREIGEAHRQHELAEAQQATGGVPGPKSPAAKPAQPLAHVEAAYREVTRVDDLAGLRIPPFTRCGGPSKSLVMLLRYAGEHSGRIIIPPQGLPCISARTPETIQNLLYQWRNEARIMAAVAETIEKSRSAGRPAWPAQFASALRANVAAVPTQNWGIHDLGLTR